MRLILLEGHPLFEQLKAIDKQRAELRVLCDALNIPWPVLQEEVARRITESQTTITPFNYDRLMDDIRAGKWPTKP